MDLKMPSWLIFAILSLIAWGVWGLLTKLASNYIEPRSAWIFQIVGYIPTVIIVLYLSKFKLETNTKGVVYALLAGVVVSLGVLFYFIALKRGKASIVVPMTALYPIITVPLVIIILKEAVTIKQILGIVLAFLAIFLFSV